MPRAFPLFVAVVLTRAVTAQPALIQRGVAVTPESVTVGDPFRVSVRVRAPRGATIEFPSRPDSGTGVDPLDPVDVALSSDSTVVEQTATYRVAAWDVGTLPIRFADILVRDGPTVRRVRVGDVKVQVVSVLPADSALRVPKPPRTVFEFGLPWWVWGLAILAAAILLAPILWLVRRRRTARQAPPDPYLEALREFDRVEGLGLVGAGERGQYVSVVTDILRTYLSRVIESARTSRTTSELSMTLRGDPRVPLAPLMQVLHDADLVKFARHPVSDEEAVACGRESRAIVDGVHEAVTAAAGTPAQDKAA
jgi:hypothetical protein